MAIKLLDYLNNKNANLLELIEAPYNLTIKADGAYRLFKYDQFNTDFNYDITREARGSIFRATIENFIPVCRPFDKFFNYGEPYAAEIDWSTAIVKEKVDGSLMKLWYDKGEWHLSTNGTIDAFKAKIGDTSLTFGYIFERAIGMSVQEFGEMMPIRNLTYMFELTSLETRVTIEYGDGVYFLAARAVTGEYIDVEKALRKIPALKFPKVYPLTSLDEVKAAAEAMGSDEEGFVVSDANGNRIKIKSPAYLVAAHAIGNYGLITVKQVLRLMKEETLDDIYGVLPESSKTRVDDVRKALYIIKTDFDTIWSWFRLFTRDFEMADFAKEAQKYPRYKDFFFAKKRRNVKTNDYLLALNIDTLTALVKEILDA